MDLGVWLRKLGLAQYEAIFRENAIDASVLHDLTEDHLREMGLPLGARLKLLKAIGALAPAAGPVPPTPHIASASQPADAAERRQVTVMFSDLVGSTALSALMDPEDLREVIAAYHKCVTEVVRRYNGFVAQYLGDGVLVYFGYPQAHEDDAERAVRAGLELIAAVVALKTRVVVQTRVGIATGLVVVGDLMDSGNAPERGIIGETPNLAARLQGIAEPNMVVIAEGTRKLLGNLFELEDFGARELKGIAGRVRAWAALRPRSVESRFEALHATDLTALIGREEEFELLLRRWSRATSGEGQVVLLSGEAGIGKSRLTAVLLERLGSEPHMRLRYFCSPQHTDSALYPIVGQLERAAGVARDDTPQAKLNKLAATLAQTATSNQDAALLAEMLSLPNDGRYPASELTPRQRRQRTMEALLAQLEALARQKPLLMIFEDAHWTDPTSLEVFGRVVDRIRNLRVLLIVTFRPEFEPPWIGQPHVTALTINRLAERDIGEMIDRIVGNKQLFASIRHDIIERSDGIPLFVEEMTKAVLEVESEGSAEHTVAAVPSPSLAVPASLHASLMARLDRLGPAKEVAQVGAAIGREFSHGVLAAVVRKPEGEVESALDRLLGAGLLFRQGIPPHATYLFKHALVQDAAYGTLLREPRRRLHARIAETLESREVATLEDRFPEVVTTRPEVLAHHYTEAGCPAQAITYRLSAGAAAANKSANLEAIDQYRRGLVLVEALSDMRERAERELDLQMALGPALFATKLYSHPDVGRTYARASSLCRQLGDDSREFTALRGRYLHHLNLVGDMHRSQHFAEEALRVAERLGNPARLVGAHMQLGVTLFYQGKLELALARFRQGFEVFDQNMQFPDWPGAHPGVQCQIWSSGLSWMLGYPDRSLDELKTAVRIVDGLPHHLTLAQTLCFAALVHIFRCEPAAAADCAGRALRICEEQSILEWQALALCMNGWALGVSGESEKGLAQIEQGLDGYGAGSLQHLFLALQADAQLAIGKPQAALEAVAAGLKGVEKTGGAPLEAQLHRLRGEALLAGAGTVNEAEMAIEEGIDVARRQNAKSWELRAAMSMARLWRDQGRRAEARNLLAPIYDWFTEGFDTRDLMEAKALLATLPS
jgi:class 3 adenylate cyclase/tetratricopeptide (TPR) repeat protein